MTLSKKELEILLERCEPFREPRVELEQYVTPAPIAADLLNLALLKGDIADKGVFDLGCGTGRLAIGAYLLGAAEVRGFDIDEEALELAKENAARAGAFVEWVEADVADIEEWCDTVVMNPPFGVKRPGADRAFLTAALRTGKVIYTMHKTTTRDFIKKYIDRLGGKVTDIAAVDFGLPRSYGFHRKRLKKIEVDVYRIEKRRMKDDRGR
ncbi:MAG: methyltransferase domain-containing protein [Methanobacteriota archaeon]|nr:MAG: methyltransferase domain-containing protein [Euryarchaeota archaeon]